MRWCFELVAQSPDATSKVCFGPDQNQVLLRLTYDRPASRLSLGRRDARGWAKEVTFALPPAGEFHASLFVSVSADMERRVVLRWPGGKTVVDWVRFDDLLRCQVWVEDLVLWHRAPQGPGNWLREWRLQRSPSGFPAPNRALDALIAAEGTERGLSFIVRAKNESATVQRCLRSIAGLGDEIVFVDNNSTDQTLTLAERLKSEIFELKTFSYPYDIPKAGEPHARQVFAGGANTLGHYYNWCLARSRRANFIKWDADYIALRDNLAEMIDWFDLRTREDNAVLWFSGLEVYTDGENYWVDSNSVHSEFRAFSLRHGHCWVNLPPWEEIDQSAFFAAQKLFHDRPVYLELFRLDESEFRDRGMFAEDTRDKERMQYIADYKAKKRVPDSFLPIEGLDDPKLAEMPLSPREMHLARYFDNHFRCAPKIAHRHTKLAIGMDMAAQDDVAVLILSCAKNADRQQAIRETWAADLRRLGIPYYFIVGRPGQESRIVGDMLFLDVPDSYEFLASKIIAALGFSLDRMNVSYIFKIDDDCVLDPYRLLVCDYRDADFTGGNAAGGPHSLIDWHVGKCANEQLDQVVFFREQNFYWIGGQFGYFLSRRARETLIAHAAEVRRSLYEDYGVTRILAQNGIPANMPFGDFVSVKWADDNWRGRPEVMVVADAPDAPTMREVYLALVGPDRFEQERRRAATEAETGFDWLDFAEMGRKLLGGAPRKG